MMMLSLTCCPRIDGVQLLSLMLKDALDLLEVRAAIYISTLRLAI